MSELLDVIADAVRSGGGHATARVGTVPEEWDDTVYVIVPHEYYAIVPRDRLPSSPMGKRIIGLCVESPGTQTFEAVVASAQSLGALVATSTEATVELRRRAIRAEHFELGYSPIWDRWKGGNGDRPVDITYLGTLESRRSGIVAGWADELWQWQVQLLMPPHEPMMGARPYFLPGDGKWHHLCRSKVILNLHREQSRTLEWVRVLEAICNGCVVVTERIVACSPLTPGVDLLVGRANVLATIAAALLREPDRLVTMRLAAYEKCRATMDMTTSAKLLLEIAARLPARRRSFTWHRARGEWRPPAGSAPLDGRIPVLCPRPAVTQEAAPPPWQSVAESLRERVVVRRGSVPTTVTKINAAAAASEVDVIVVPEPGRSVGTVCIGGLRCQAGSGVLGLRVALDGAKPPEFSESLRFAGGSFAISHPEPLGRGYTVNRALGTVSAPMTLVIDANTRLLPPAVGRLRAALARSGEEAAYCIARRDRTMLMNVLPPEARRLAVYPYLWGGVLARTEVLRKLGGFAEDPLLAGLEWHDFWCRFVEAGLRAILVPEILFEWWGSDPSAVRPVDLDAASSWQMLTSRSPRLHRGPQGA